MQRSYEVMFIVRPDILDEDMDKLISTIETNISNAGGTVKNTERMGKRRLAYMVGKFADGIYILVNVEGTGAMISEIERRLRVTEQVIKYITVRVDQTQKRLDKIKKLRDSKVRTPRPVATPAAAPEAAEAAGSETPAAV